MLHNLNDVLQKLPEMTELLLTKRHSTWMFYDEAARQSFIRLLTNFSRAEVMDFSTFVLTRLGSSREDNGLMDTLTTTITDIIQPITAM